MKNIKLNRRLWVIVGGIGFITSLIGITVQSIYDVVVSPEILPGVISQDTITFILSAAIMFLGIRLKTNFKIQHILGLSILSYLFYAYAIYSIEQLYNEFYLVYLLITGLSFYAFVIGLVSIKKEEWNKKLPKKLQYTTIIFSIFVVILFTFLWLMQLIPLIETKTKEEFTFSIYILDLVFIMPGFGIITYLVYKQNPYGIILAPVIFFKAFTLLFSVGIGYYYRAFYNLDIIITEGIFYLVIAAVFLLLSLYHFRHIKEA